MFRKTNICNCFFSNGRKCGKQSEKSIDHEGGNATWALSNHESIAATLSLFDAIVVCPEISDHNTSDSTRERDVLLPVLVLSVFFNLVLEVGDIAVSEHNIWGFNEVVHWDVKLHSIGWDPDCEVVEHSEEREYESDETRVAWAREVSNDTIDNASENRLDVETFLSTSKFWFFFDFLTLCKEILAFLNMSFTLCWIHLMISKSLTADLYMFIFFCFKKF